MALISKEQIAAAMALDAAGVEKALNHNYPTDIVETATFSGMNEHSQFVYDCMYTDDTGCECKMPIFVYYKHTTLVADY